MSKFKLLAVQSRTRVMKMWCPCCDLRGSRRLPVGHYLRFCLDLPLAWVDGSARRAMVCTACKSGIFVSGLRSSEMTRTSFSNQI